MKRRETHSEKDGEYVVIFEYECLGWGECGFVICGFVVCGFVVCGLFAWFGDGGINLSLLVVVGIT